MNTQNFNHNRRIVERYTDQPSRLPSELRRQIETLWQGDPVQLYALADLAETICYEIVTCIHAHVNRIIH